MADLGGQLIGDIPDDEAVVTAENAHRLVGLDDLGAAAIALRRLARRVGSELHSAMAGLTVGAIPDTGRPAPRSTNPSVIHEDRCERGGQVLGGARHQRPRRRLARPGAQGRSGGRVRAHVPHARTPDAAADPGAPARRRPAPHRSTGAHARLDDAMQRYWAEQIRDGERHTREVLVVLSAHNSRGARLRVRARVRSPCRARCVNAHRLNGAALSRDASPTDSTAMLRSTGPSIANTRSTETLVAPRPRAATPPGTSRRPRMARAAAQRAGRDRHRHPPRAGAAR